MQLEKMQYEIKGRATGGFGLLPRFLVALFAATLTPAQPSAVLAQQHAQAAGKSQGAAAVIETRKERPMSQPGTVRPADTKAIRPFRIKVEQSALEDLRRRINATKWPERETVTDSSQGLPLATMQKLARYWATEYDWRKAEARLNALPQFVTEIDGLDIHFIHVRSKNLNALPLIVTHGWPGSIIEQLKIIDPLVNPTAHGGRAEDSFDVVIPSMPGYGFSGKPTTTGWGVERMARAWDVLMKRLGYTRYVAQGGDWGAFVVDQMGLQAPAGLLAIHTNMPATVPADVDKALLAGTPPPSGLSAEERRAYEQLVRTFKQVDYARLMGARPQTLYGIADSPVGLASWLLDHNDADGQPAAAVASALNRTASPAGELTRDEILDNITLYWLTNTGVSASRLYWEYKGGFFNAKGVSIPVAVSVFPGEQYEAPRSWTERAYPKLIYYNRLDKGGHFAAWEQPQLFAAELRAAFKSLRQANATANR
ncbi:MAG TPA: epoxide hydrolase [Pyrinomonadaceae bacterium]|nr:epoxide hydrolase [Pyrinomonadaceae bacterium]